MPFYVTADNYMMHQDHCNLACFVKLKLISHSVYAF